MFPSQICKIAVSYSENRQYVFVLSNIVYFLVKASFQLMIHSDSYLCNSKEMYRTTCPHLSS